MVHSRRKRNERQTGTRGAGMDIERDFALHNGQEVEQVEQRDSDMPCAGGLTTDLLRSFPT